MNIKKRKRSNGISNIFILGCSFSVLLLITSYLLISYERETKERNLKLTYSELLNNYEVIADTQVYDFMNSIFFTDAKEPIDSFRINCFAESDKKELTEQINTIEKDCLSQEDKIDLISQLDDKVFMWDKSKLRNAICLTPSDYSALNNNHENSVAYWEKFNLKVGPHGIQSFSRPIFTKRRDVCIIEQSVFYNPLNASTNLLMFKKANSKWTLTWQKNLISL